MDKWSDLLAEEDKDKERNYRKYQALLFDTKHDSVGTFHDALLESLREPYDKLSYEFTATKTLPIDVLQSFLMALFPAYESSERFATLLNELETIEDQMGLLPSPLETSNSAVSANSSPATHFSPPNFSPSSLLPSTPFIRLPSFQTLRQALLNHLQERLLQRDTLPLEKELILPPYFSQLPVSMLKAIENAANRSPGRKQNACYSNLLTEYNAEVLKKSNSWLGRWQNRVIVVRWNELEIYRKSSSFRPGSTNSFSSSSSSSASSNVSMLSRSESLHLAGTSPTNLAKSSAFVGSSSGGSGNTGNGRDGSGGRNFSQGFSVTSVNSKFKRFFLRDLSALEIVSLRSEGDPHSKKQALRIDFVESTSGSSSSSSTSSSSFSFSSTSNSSNNIGNSTGGSSMGTSDNASSGGNGTTTHSLLFTAEKHETLHDLRAQIASFCLFYALEKRQPVEVLKKFVNARAMLDSFCIIRSKKVSFPLKPLQLAFLNDDCNFRSVGFLLEAGANPSSLLQWTFASNHVFGDLFGRMDRVHSEKCAQFVLQMIASSFFALDLVGQDGYQWNVLMFLCWRGDVKSLALFLKAIVLSPNVNWLRFLDHVNSDGDTALHVAIKCCHVHNKAEEIALTLVDASTRGPRFFDSGLIASHHTTNTPMNSSLIHKCDANGESAFHLALKAKMWKLADRLVDLNADPTSCDPQGNTALHLSIKVGAPLVLISKIMRLYQPPRVSPLATMHLSRTQLYTTLGYECCERQANDTALSLALKLRQQDVVVSLLESGALPNVNGCRWTSDDALDKEMDLVGSTPLHFAIKSGLAIAATSLVVHGANLHVLDSQKSSPLALAIRHGMYSLSHQIALKLKKEDALENRWVDEKSGESTVVLALKAGQLELATLLLDLANEQIFLNQSYSRESLLHLLVKVCCWLETRSNELGSGGSLTDNLTMSAELRKPTRTRLKSKSDGDLHFPLIQSGSIADGAGAAAVAIWGDSAYSNNDLMSKRTSNASASTRKSGLDSLDFSSESSDSQETYKRAIKSMIVGILQRLPDISMLTTASKCMLYEMEHGICESRRLSFRLPNASSLTVTDDYLDSYTAIHAAAGASSGVTTLEVLWLFLVFIDVKTGNAREEMLSALSQSVGLQNESLLHEALRVHAHEKALVVLYFLRILSGKVVVNRAMSSWKPSSSFLLQIGQIYDASTFSEGMTALHYACQKPNDPQMRVVIYRLLESGMFGSGWNKQGLSPLHLGILAECGRELVELFHRFGQDLNVWTEDQSSAISSSAVASSSASSKMLLDGSRTPLMLAIEKQNVDVCRALVDCGAHLKLVTPKTRWSLLHFAVEKNVSNPLVVRFLLSLKPLVTYQVVDIYGFSSEQMIQRLQQLLYSSGGEQDPNSLNKQGEQQLSRTSVSAAVDDNPADNSSLQPLEIKILYADHERESAVHINAPIEEEEHEREREHNNEMEQDRGPKQPTSEAPTNSTSWTPTQASSSAPVLPSNQHTTSRPQSADKDPSNHRETLMKRFAMMENALNNHLRHALTPVNDTMMLNNTNNPRGVRRLGGMTTLALDDGSGGSANASGPFTNDTMQLTSSSVALKEHIAQHLLEEEKATLTIVAQEAKREAKEWLRKRIGQKKLLSDARAQQQSALSNFANSLAPSPKEKPMVGPGMAFVQASVQAPAPPPPPSPPSTEQEDDLQQFKASAAKKFIDKHVAECVAEAKMEIERERQQIFQEMGVWITLSDPLETAPVKVSTRGLTGTVLSNDANNSFLSVENLSFMSNRTGANSTLMSGSGGSFLSDLDSELLARNNGSVLLSESVPFSSVHPRWPSTLAATATNANGSFVVGEDSVVTTGVEGFGRPTDLSGPKLVVQEEEQTVVEEQLQWTEEEYSNPLDRESFALIIQERKTLS